MADEEKTGAEEMGRPPLREVAEEQHRQYHPSDPYYQGQQAPQEQAPPAPPPEAPPEAKEKR